MIDLKIQYVGMKESEAVSANIQQHLDTLVHNCRGVLSCHALVSRPHKKKAQGNTFHVKLRFHLAGKNIIVDKDNGKNHAHEDVYVTIRDAFWAAKRKIDDFNRVRSGNVKLKNRSQHGRILRIIPHEDCGFLITEDNREIYFHKNSLIRGAFEELSKGQEIRFAEEPGENGPQASSLEVVGNTGHIAG